MRTRWCSWCAVVALFAGAGGVLAGPPATPVPDVLKMGPGTGPAQPAPTAAFMKSGDGPEPAPGAPTPAWPPPVLAVDHGGPGADHGGHNTVAHATAGHEQEARIIFGGEYFLMAPRRRAQDYALVGTAPFGGPVGTLKSVEGSYDSGFRIGAGYRFAGESVEVLFNYTHLHTSADDAVLQGPPGQLIFATQTHPAAVTQVATAKADNSINLNLFDLEVGRRLRPSEHTELRVFAGPRFANLDQKFTAVYTGGDVRTDVVHRAVTFDGGGLRAGAEVTQEIFQHVGVYFRGSASLMTGRFRSSLSETGNGVPVVRVEEKFNKVIPVVDMGIGLRFEKGPLRIGVGYEFMNWFGMLEGFDFVDDAHPAKMTRRAGDLGFDGIVFRMEYLF